jgi:hypothetical protein
MSDIPCIMSAPMVLATLREIEAPGSGKTMTRRLAWRVTSNFRALGEVPPSGLAPTTWQSVKPGDRLWVRENWYAAHGADKTKPSDMDGTWKICPAVDYNYAKWGVKGKLRVAMHMPRIFSRLTLIVTATKIERLQDISEQDARAEGWQKRLNVSDDPEVHADAARDWFSDLWTSLHGPGAWDANPEVCCISFKPVLANIDALPKAEAA